MKRGLLVFLAICAFAVAMVPRVRRAVNTEELVEVPEGAKKVCDRVTPCAWSVYKSRDVKIVELYINNTYCSCGAGTICLQDEDVLESTSYVYRCRERRHDEYEEN